MFSFFSSSLRFAKSEVGTAMERIDSDLVLYPSMSVCAFDSDTVVKAEDLLPLRRRPNISKMLKELSIDYYVKG